MLTRATKPDRAVPALSRRLLSPLEIDEAVTRALAEDLGRAGDVTSIATIPPGTPGGSRTVMWRGRPATIAGLPLAAACFRKLAPNIEIVPVVGDGATIEARPC
jgi:nicotinate-nucleotide pyrophosphorylase (carboxylating)